MTSNPNKLDKKESNSALILSGIIIALIVIALVTNGFGIFDKKPIAPKNPVPLAINNSPVIGNENAPLIIYEFSDFSCPYCAAAAGYNPKVIAQLKKQDPNWIAPLPKIKEDYVKTGKVKIVYKYMKSHGTAKAAQDIGWCLNDQSLFWEFYNKAFANQENTSSIDEMRNIAKNLGADMNKLQQCLDSKKYEYMYENDQAMANTLNLDGTPAFVINGKVMSGALSYTEFKKVIDSQLNVLVKQ